MKVSKEVINQTDALLKSLTGEKKEYLKKYLNNAPEWFLESLQVVHKEKNNIFVRESCPVDNVYILIDGIVRAIDYRIFGIAYDYMWFYAVSVFGNLEIITQIEKYKTTLMTVTDCTMLVVSKSKFERWIMNDNNALRMEAQYMCNSLLEQARKERAFIFLQGIDRIMYLFVQSYEQTAKSKCVINLTRKELSERSGLCIKTINRAIKKLYEDNYIERSGNKIIITGSQYHTMKKYLEPLVEHI